MLKLLYLANLKDVDTRNIPCTDNRQITDIFCLSIRATMITNNYPYQQSHCLPSQNVKFFKCVLFVPSILYQRNLRELLPKCRQGKIKILNMNEDLGIS